jgi:hypothetical protein
MSGDARGKGETTSKSLVQAGPSQSQIYDRSPAFRHPTSGSNGIVLADVAVILGMDLIGKWR